MTIHVILNPYANRWRANRQRIEIESALSKAGLDFVITPTTGPQHATQLASDAAAAHATAVVAAGGDGTVHEVANGLLRQAGEEPTVPLGVLPIGNGNDFSDNMGLPRDLPTIAQILAAGKYRTIDVGRVTGGTLVGERQECQYFVNSCAAAMEPLVTLEASKLKRVTGELRYVIGLVRALVKLKAWDMTIESKNSLQSTNDRFNAPTYLLSICNGPRVGKVFMMFPGADFEDGHFDVVWIRKVSLTSVLAIVPRFFRGTHVAHREVNTFSTTCLQLSCHPGTPVHCDGEIVGEDWTEFRVELLPRKLRVIS